MTQITSQHDIATADISEPESQRAPETQRWIGSHTINIRFNIPWFTKPYYVTILAGPELRSSERLRTEREKHPLITKANVAVLFTIGFILGGSCWIGLQTLATAIYRHLVS